MVPREPHADTRAIPDRDHDDQQHLRFSPPPIRSHVPGCKDCEFDRLTQWAVDRGLLTSAHTPPLAVSRAIIDHLEKLERRARGEPVQLPLPRGHQRRINHQGWARCACGWDPVEKVGVTRTSQALLAVERHIRAHEDAVERQAPVQIRDDEC